MAQNKFNGSDYNHITPPPPLSDSLSKLPRFGDLQWFLWALEQIKKVQRMFGTNFIFFKHFLVLLHN